MSDRYGPPSSDDPKRFAGLTARRKAKGLPVGDEPNCTCPLPYGPADDCPFHADRPFWQRPSAPAPRSVDAVVFCRQVITEKMRAVAVFSEVEVAIGASVAILDAQEASYDGEVIAIDYTEYPRGGGVRRKLRVALAGRGRERVR
ncbi:MAG: hypothetical protein ACRDPE_15250 [Solirubrobacterales bacterium]